MERYNTRGGYGFTLETKELARKRANGRCEYSSCDRPNTGRINHLSGILEGKIKGTPKSWIRSLDNAVLQCELHEAVHDVEERSIIYLMQHSK